MYIHLMIMWNNNNYCPTLKRGEREQREGGRETERGGERGGGR